MLPYGFGNRYRLAAALSNRAYTGGRPAPARRKPLLRTATIIAVLLLSGCNGANLPQTGRPPTYRIPFGSGNANSGFEPPNALPP